MIPGPGDYNSGSLQVAMATGTTPYNKDRIPVLISGHSYSGRFFGMESSRVKANALAGPDS